MASNVEFLEHKLGALEKENHDIKMFMRTMKEEMDVIKMIEQDRGKKRVRGKEVDKIIVAKTDLIVNYEYVRDNCISQLQNILHLRDDKFLFNEIRYKFYMITFTDIIN